MTYFNTARQKAREMYYPPPKKRKLKTSNMKKKDPQKKLLITAIKKTINKNSVLPILEDVLLTGTEAVVTDLETSVVIPYPTGINVCVPSTKFIDILDMMEDPAMERVTARVLEPHFKVDKKVYLGSEDEVKAAWEEAVAEQNCQIEFDEYCATYCTEVTPDYEWKYVDELTYGVNFTKGKRVVKVTGENPDNFPRIPLLDQDYPVIGKLNESDMVKLANALSFVSNDDLRPAMTGILLGEKIVATDAHRLYFDDLSEPVTRQFILPAKAAKILLALGGEWKLTAEESKEVPPPHFELDSQLWHGVKDELEEEYEQRNDGKSEEDGDTLDQTEFNEWLRDVGGKRYYPNDAPTNVCFSREDGVKVVSRSIDARFPDYKCVIPEGEGNTVVTINPDELLQELKNASKFANRSTSQVTFGVNGKLTIAAQDIDFGEEYTNDFELAEIQHNSGEGFDIAFNAKFLTEIVTKEKDGPITMKLWAPTKAAIINDHYLVMPLMINEGN